MALVLLIAAFILFVVAGVGVAVARVNLVAFGLACWVLADLLPRIAGLGA
jgi:hypothetical protein